MKRKIIYVICISMLSCLLCLSFVSAKTKSVKFNLVSVKLEKNDKKTIVLKNVKKKVKWKIKDGKVIKIEQKKGKYKNKIIIVGKRTGKTTLVAIVGKKKYKLKIQVINKNKRTNKKETRAPVSQTTAKTETTTGLQPETKNEEVTTNTIVGKVECDVIYRDGKINVSITNKSDTTIGTGYTDFRLLKKEEDQWINGIPDGMTYMLEEMFMYVENGKQLQFSIPFYKENSHRELVQVENPLVKGHYKYVHYFQGKNGKESVECEFDVE